MTKRLEVSERNFIDRMKRSLRKKDDLILHKYRNPVHGAYFFTTHAYTNMIEHERLGWDTVVEWGREDGVLKPYEYVEGLESL